VGRVLLAFFIYVVIVILLDQGTKMLVASRMHISQSIPLWENVLHITYVRNTGAAFGIFAEKTYLFIGITALVTGLIVLYVYRLPPGSLLFRLSLAMVTGGALGNMLDRLRVGYVIDFIDLRIWPVFNLADSAIVVGVFLFIYTYWKNV